MNNILCPECKHNNRGNCMRRNNRFIDVVLAEACDEKKGFFEKKETNVNGNGKKKKKK